jgi:uracil permease
MFVFGEVYCIMDNSKFQSNYYDTKLGVKGYVLGVQHLFAMFGATILVPLITGLNPAVALVTAGIGTLLFHLITKGKVPVFLGSSFAFMGAISAVTGVGTATGSTAAGISLAQGGIICAGAVYFIFAILAYFLGAERLRKFFPPVVTGPIIMVIGTMYASSVALSDAMGTGTTNSVGISLLVAFSVVLIIVLTSIIKKGFFKLVPILLGMTGGYIICLILKAAGVFDMSFAAVASASWLNIPYVTEGFMSIPKFDWMVILSIAPIALVTFMEHVGDITANGAVVGKDFFKDPGLHRTLLGDGLATLVAGFFGGPPNTTYSENTGVLATTKNYNPKILRVAAVLAIILGFFGKFGAVLQTIPNAVRGGAEIILFGMIAAVGIQTLAKAKLDFTHSRNMIIVALILILGLGISGIGGISIPLSNGGTLTLSGLFIATVVGVIANAVLPAENKEENAEEINEK